MMKIALTAALAGAVLVPAPLLVGSIPGRGPESQDGAVRRTDPRQFGAAPITAQTFIVAEQLHIVEAKADATVAGLRCH
jgi:hypothetical protein